MPAAGAFFSQICVGKAEMSRRSFGKSIQGTSPFKVVFQVLSHFYWAGVIVTSVFCLVKNKSTPEKFMEQIEDVHLLFQEFVSSNRPVVNIDEVSTGEAWYGERAKAINLVDDLMTSDEYIVSRCNEAEVYEVRWVQPPKKPIEKLVEQVEGRFHLLTNYLVRLFK